MAIAVIEMLNFGLGHLADAARDRGEELYLFTGRRSYYRYELSRPEVSEIKIVDVDTFNEAAVIDSLRNIPNLRGIVRAADRWNNICIDSAKALGLPHQTADAINLVRNKAELRNYLADRGLSRGRSTAFDPHSVTASDIQQLLTYPSIVKDIAGAGSENVWLVQSRDDLDLVLNAARSADNIRGGALAAEPYFLGPLYSAETLSWDGATRVLGFTGRTMSAEPNFREENASFPIAFPGDMEERLSGWIGEILSAVGYSSGFTHTEFIITTTGPEIVEINPRLGGLLVGETLCQSFEVNIYGAFLDLALGRRPELMDITLQPRRGTSQAIIYAPHEGTFLGFGGEEKLALHPGAPVLYPLRYSGDRITSTIDQRGIVGLLFSTGATSELALYNTLSMTGKLDIRVQRDGEHT